MSKAAGPLTGCRIPLVEDEYPIAMAMRRWLAEAGAEVVGPVPSVDQGLDLIEAGPLDAAVPDIDLGDGERIFPVIERLEALGVPYLFATGDVRILKAPDYEGRPRLEKPILSHELQVAARALVRTAQSMR